MALLHDDQLRDELDDGPETMEDLAALKTVMTDAWPPGLLRDEDDADDTTPTEPAAPALQHQDLQEKEESSAPVALPSFFVQSNSTNNTNIVFQEMGKSRPCRGATCATGLARGTRVVKGSRGLRGLAGE